MKPLSLLPKYLLITAAVCAAAVFFTAFALYILFRSSLDGALAQSTHAYQEHMQERVQTQAHTTTAALAERLAQVSGDRNQTVRGVLARAMVLDGASLIALQDESGTTLEYAGNVGLIPQVALAGPGDTVAADGLIVSRASVPGSDLSVAQAFDAAITSSEVETFKALLSGMLAQYGRKGIAWGAAISLVAIVGAGLFLIIFAFRQVGDIRYLTRSAERMSSGSYDGAIELHRTDEIGQLASTFDQLRERLRTTTISRDHLDRVLGSMSEALLLAGPQGVITRANPAATRLLERSESELIGRSIADLVVPGRRAEFNLADSGARAQETSFLSGSNQEVPVSYTISEIHDSDPAARGFIVAARNIAERKMAEQRIRYLARIDALTKVPNRMQFQHLLQRSIARAGRQGRQLALLYLDVDRFKDINDIYGHSAGDLCLETLTDRLARLLPESTIMGRFAGDEFGVILEDIEGPGEGTLKLANTARGTLREISQVVPFHGQQIYMTASIGIAMYPEDARNVIDLIRSADSALYHAKHAGGDTFEFFDPEMNAMAAERLMLKSKLRRAYERNELLLHYQPKVDLKTGRVAGAEALVRWDLSERGIVLPSEFIPLAEESNLILDIGEWVLDRVCRDFQSWQAQMLFPGKVAVNLSLKQLRQPSFSQRVGNIFRKHGVPPASLELEITESTLMENPERTIKILDELYSMGLSLAIDDFGTGYSSLSALQKFPITTLKIDQSFVRDAATDADDATIVSTIIQMGHGLNLDVIAEGVESPNQLAFLRSTGCDYVQGLLFGEPMSAPEFMQLLLSQRFGAPAFGTLFAAASPAPV